MTARRLVRPIAALILIPTALYALYIGWRNWGVILGSVAELVTPPGPARGLFRGVVEDFRLLIEVAIVVAVAGVLDWLLSWAPSPEAEPAHPELERRAEG